MADSATVRLTARQRQIVTLAAGGATNRQIALELGIRPKTVTNTVTRVLRAAGCTSRLQLALWALRTGQVELDDIRLYGREEVDPWT